MIYKYFYISLIIQIVLLSITPLIFFWIWEKGYMLVTSYSLILLWIMQIIYLVYFINKTNRDLARFFEAFRYQDATLVFSDRYKSRAFSRLYKSFNDIINAFGKVKIEKERDYTFFQNTLQHVGIGLIGFNQDGRVLLCNGAFKRLFHIESPALIEDLSTVAHDFSDFVLGIDAGKQELKKFLVNNEPRTMAVKAVEFSLEKEQIKLLSFQDIKNEIEQGEMDAWQKLIRVLTHEIMNSVSPITLLSSSLIELYQTNSATAPPDVYSQELHSNIVKGLKTIRKRSKGLTSFVEEYRSLTQLPQPHFELVKVAHFFESVEVLFKEECRNNGIDLIVKTPSVETEIIADERLLEQILINLIRNAMQAVEGQVESRIELSGIFNFSRFQICVKDNGPGIPVDLLDNIFTPFFTTKQDGSGIGLSLSRQIMRLHGGSISVKSEPGKETAFTLQF